MKEEVHFFKREQEEEEEKNGGEFFRRLKLVECNVYRGCHVPPSVRTYCNGHVNNKNQQKAPSAFLQVKIIFFHL